MQFLFTIILNSTVCITAIRTGQDMLLWALIALLVIVVLVLVVFLMKSRIHIFKLTHNQELKRNEFFQKLYNNSPVMLHSINMDGELVFVNDYWLKALKYRRDEVIGQKSEIFFTGALRDDYRQHFATLLEKGVLKNYEARMLKGDGTEIDVVLTAELFYDNRNVPVQSFTTILDISDRKQAEEDVIRSKFKLDSILDNAVEAIFVLQNELIQYANPATNEILGYSPEELNNISFKKFVHNEDKQWVISNYKRRMNGEKVPERYSFRVLRRGDKVRWVEINAIFLYWEEKPAILIFLVDITERKKYEQMLLTQRNEVIEKNCQVELFNQELKAKNKALDQHQQELEEYADELQAALEEVDVKSRRITAAHNDMLDSIEYARIIQEAVLKTSDNLEGIFDHYILFRPKDIVSGDFYFFKQIDQYYLFSLGDCTGHGVPGGFLTMLSVNLLQEVIVHSDITKPKKVLEKLRAKMKNVFYYSRQHDGMDLALCIYNTETKKLTYAGANIPVIIISNNEEQLIAPVHNPVGYYVQEKPFEEYEVQIHENDMLYLFSDGYKDQFGGKRSKKYQFSRFRELLHSLHHLPLWEQKQQLLNEHIRWKSEEPQLDDITVVGVKLS